MAVFIDGCFWHGCPAHYVAPKANAEYWARKVGVNCARDLDTDMALTAAGWTVLRFWEHTDAPDIADMIERAVASNRAGRSR